MATYIGLHITRTAGTSFFEAIASGLGRDRCMSLSSFSQLEMDGDVTPFERIFDHRLYFYFGHYIHESLIGYLASKGETYKFSIVREPASRLVSEYIHKTRNLSIDIDAPEFFKSGGDGLIAEFIRAMPSVTDVFPKASRLECALIVASAFDVIVCQQQVETFTNKILHDFSVKPRAVERINSSPDGDYNSLLQMANDAVGDDGVFYYSITSNRVAEFIRQGEILLDYIKTRYGDVEMAKKTMLNYLFEYCKSEIDLLDISTVYINRLRERQGVLDWLTRKFDRVE